MSLITVEQQPGSDLFMLGGLLEGHVYQGLGVLASKLMRHDETIEQVLDGGEVAPALLRGNEGDICHPFLVGAGGGELTVEQVVIAMVDSQGGHFFVGFAFAGDGMNVEFVH